MSVLQDRSGILRRIVAVLAIGFASAGTALLLGMIPGVSRAMQLADHVLYDTFYRARPAHPQESAPVVILGIDDRSLEEVDRQLGFGWPWPRPSWAVIARYLQDAGARAMVLDVLLSERSANGTADDDEFAASIDQVAQLPLVFARVARPDGQWGRFKPQIQRPVEFGGVDVSTERVYRDFHPTRHGRPTLALAAVRAAGLSPKLAPDQPFLLHYYGPHRDAGGRPTFPTYMASRPILAQAGEVAGDLGIEPAHFRDKIVVVGSMAEGLQDIKAAPHDPRFPGCEVQATAILNLIRGDAVRPVPPIFLIFTAAGAATLASLGAIAPRQTWIKLLAAAVVISAVILVAQQLFLGQPIRWLAPAGPLLASVLALVGGMAWSHFVEDRRARVLFKALEQCLSHDVAVELERDPRRLAVGGRQLEMTVMFTDLAGFTALTEELKEKIGPTLNYYLGEMTEQIHKVNGTLDKYIGDAIMTFWNAPLDQPEHARHACDAALAIQRREREIAPRMAELGAPDTLTRIGINSGQMFVGFTGSARKLNYTVIGDAVNLAARLEPANKLYGTQILVSEATAERCREWFLFRRVDLLQVKGKSEPIGVHELLGDAEAGAGPLGALCRRFEQAFELYRARKWDSAEALLLELAAQFPDDGPTKTLLGRVRAYRQSPPPPDWDGVFVATTK